MEQLKFKYKNWKGVTSTRIVIPKGIEFKVSEWHGTEPVWLMVAVDVEKGVLREFKLADIIDWL
jgi:predicted DNA-binding transcriptional regulator YafY